MEKKDIFPIAIGSFGLGASRSESWSDDNSELVVDENEMNAIIYSYEHGQNYIDTSYIYAGGLTMKFIAEFIKRVDKDKLFIAVKIENYIEKVEDISTRLITNKVSLKYKSKEIYNIVDKLNAKVKGGV